MGNVAVSIKIMPESDKTNLENVKKEIEKKMKVHDFKIEPIAFGLKTLKIVIIIPDAETEKIEKEIKSVKGVSTVEIESATLI